MPDGHFKKGVWKSVAEQLTREGTNGITADKARQHFKYLKSKYQAYASLGNKSGWGWDSENNMPMADDAQWVDAIKANKKLSMCRQPWPHYPMLYELCGRDMATGKGAIFSSKDNNQEEDAESTGSSDDPNDIHEVSIGGMRDLDLNAPPTASWNSDSLPDTAPSSRGASGEKSSGSGSKRRRDQASSSSRKKVFNVLEDIRDIGSALSRQSEVSDLYVKAVSILEGMGLTDDEVVAGVAHLQTKNEQFVFVQWGDSRRRSFVRWAYRKEFGYLPPSLEPRTPPSPHSPVTGYSFLE